MVIEWDNYLWNKECVASEKEVQQTEFELKVKLPSDFLLVACKNQGKSPEPSVFNVGKGDDVFNNLLHFKTEGPHKEYGILATKKSLANFLSNDLIPIAGTPGGNYICFQYSEKCEPCVVHVNHEFNITDPRCVTKLSNNFTDFLNGLSDG